MTRRNLGLAFLIGALVTIPALALLNLASALLGVTFGPFALFNALTRSLPGPLITFGIDAMIDTFRFLGIDVADTAKLAEQAMAMLLSFVLGALSGPILLLILRRRQGPDARLVGTAFGTAVGLIAGALVANFGREQVSVFLEAGWALLAGAAWGAVLGSALSRLGPAEGVALEAQEDTAEVEVLSRRQFLITLGAASAGITVIGAGLAAVLSDEEGAETASTATGEEFGLPNADDPVQPAPGTRPEYTPIEDHYKVFIGLEPSRVDGDSWVLPVDGLVDNPLQLTLEDLRTRYTQVDQYVTLSCISGRIPTTLISTTRWSGVPLAEVLAEAQLQEEARYLHIRSADGFYETLDLELLEEDPRIMLCHSWDGRPLPQDNGFPLRIWIPDRFGMKQPKWITEIEVSDSYVEGYWVERGWDEVARTRTRSVIDTVAVEAAREVDGQRVVPIGGIAFAGARGISSVQVRVDGGDWQEAMLRTPLSEATWVIWRLDWPFEAGEHTFEVRCFEADGTPQITEQTPPRPSGATGVHSLSQQVG